MDAAFEAETEWLGRPVTHGAVDRALLVVVGVGTRVVPLVERVDEQFLQLLSFLGRQFVQVLPAFTQAQLLQEPVLLHLQHATMTTLTTPNSLPRQNVVTLLTHTLAYMRTYMYARVVDFSHRAAAAEVMNKAWKDRECRDPTL